MLKLADTLANNGWIGLDGFGLFQFWPLMHPPSNTRNDWVANSNMPVSAYCVNTLKRRSLRLGFHCSVPPIAFLGKHTVCSNDVICYVILLLMIRNGNGRGWVGVRAELDGLGCFSGWWW